MIYCLNPHCKQRLNPDDLEHCQACGTSLVVRDRYRLIRPLRPLNSRSMTEVFEVDDFGVRKVMKILKDDFPDVVDRFQREFITLLSLNHPGIPKVEAGGYFTLTPNPNVERSMPQLHGYVMEKIEGQTLEEFISEQGRISSQQARLWLRQLLEIIDAIHHHPEPLFHRDIKPSNIILKPNGQLVLIDFGTARGLTNTYVQNYNLGRITAVISGGYTPQEQVDGKALPQSDFFALGRTFVHLLTGTHPTELPIDSKNGQLIWRNLAPQIPPPLADFIDELMAQVPGNRPQNAMGAMLALNRLRWNQFQRFLKSPQFKIMVAIGIVTGIGYYLSFPWQAQTLYEQGLKDQQAQNLNRARQSYEKALQYNPKDSRIYNNLGLVCEQMKDISCAKRYYQKALAIENDSGTLYNLAQVYEQTEDFDRAEAQYKKAIALGGTTTDYSLSALARLSILQGNLDEAIELSQQGLQKTQKSKVRSALYRNLGWVYWIQGDNAKAEENLNQALQWQQDRTEAYCLLALVQESQEKYSAALESWQLCRHSDAKNRVEILTWQTMARQRLMRFEQQP